MILDYRLEYKIYCKYWREKAGFKIYKNYCQTWSFFNKFCCDVYSLCMFQRDAYEDLMTKAQSCPTVSAVSGFCVLWSALSESCEHSFDVMAVPWICQVKAILKV